MYISGVPGTGKTATVRQVSQHLHDLYDSGQLPEFKFIEINGLMCKEPRKAYVTTLKVNFKYTVLSVDSYRVVDQLPWYCLYMYDKIVYSLVPIPSVVSIHESSVLYLATDWAESFSKQSCRCIR